MMPSAEDSREAAIESIAYVPPIAAWKIVAISMAILVAQETLFAIDRVELFFVWRSLIDGPVKWDDLVIKLQHHWSAQSSTVTDTDFTVGDELV
jgi:hypothetical protein